MSRNIDVATDNHIVGGLQQQAVVVLHHSHRARNKQSESSLADQVVRFEHQQLIECAIVFGVAGEEHIAVARGIADQPAFSGLQ